VMNLSKELARRGNDVAVLTTTSGPRFIERRFGFEVRRQPAFLKVLNNPLSWAVHREWDLVRSSDIVHVHNEHSFLTLNIMAVRRRLKGRVPLTLHGELKFGTPPLDIFARKYRATLGRFVLGRADMVFVSSEEERQDLLARGVQPRKVVLVHNAVDEDTLANHLDSNSAQKIRSRFGIDAESKIVLFVGRLIPRKGIRTLLECFRLCVARRPDLFLVIVGDGPLRGLVDSTIEKWGMRRKVRVEPYLQDIALHQVYQGADVLVLPSIAEGLPTVLLEAMFYGCPTVASDIRGIRDSLGDRTRLVPVGDARRFTEEVLASIRDRDRVRRGSIARNTIDVTYTWTKVGEEYEHTFARLLEDRDYESQRG